jgi:type IV pilus assembly protein PilB
MAIKLQHLQPTSAKAVAGLECDVQPTNGQGTPAIKPSAVSAAVTVELHAQAGLGVSMEAAMRELGVKESHIRAALHRRAITGESTTDIMKASDYGFLSPEQIARVNARVDDMAYWPPGNIDLVMNIALKEAIPQLRQGLFRFEGFIPVAIADSDLLTVAVSEYQDSIQAQKAFTRFRVQYVIASQRTIQSIYRKYFADTAAQVDWAYQSLKTTPHDSEALPGLLRKLILSIIRHACYQGASDIGLQPMVGPTGGIIRLKRSGVGELFRYLEWDIFVRIMNYFLTESGKREIARSEPIESKLQFNDADREHFADIVDRYAFRVEIIPRSSQSQGDDAFYTVVIRVLDQQADAVDIDQLGFDADTREHLVHSAAMEYGLILVTGPTGSGKTTTLYALLNTIDPIERWLQTIENPIEYPKGTWMSYQTPAHIDEATASSRLLKGLLRNAPNVVLNGEVRDAEMADTLMTLANTGHLVFSTLHNNDAALAVTRLSDFGLDMSGVASILRAILAQRLIRVLCPHCKEPDQRLSTHQQLQEEWIQHLNPQPYRSGKGCLHCEHTAYRGRRMVYELLLINEDVRRLIESRASPSAIAAKGIDPTRTIRANGLRLVSQGLVDMDMVNTMAPRLGHS